jgi:hypothetical protein
MEEIVPFASRTYGILFVLLLLARSMDFLSTWVATPNLVLEGNPVAKKMGWRWGIPVNLLMCFGLAFWPLPAIVISTTSLMVAARNFQSAWLMRSLGERLYRDWHVERIQETSATLFLSCLFGQTILIGLVGGAIVFFSTRDMIPWAIGLGIIGYAVAVTFYTLLSVVRLRRAEIRKEVMADRHRTVEEKLSANSKSRPHLAGLYLAGERPEPQGK